jgi:dTDP-D-glucose 4,6-dehydratase
MHEFYFEKLENSVGTSEKLITYVKDRPGYDLRMDGESDEYQNYYEEQYK